MTTKSVVCVHLFNDRSGSPKVLAQVITCLTHSGTSVELITSHHSDGFLSNLPCKRRIVFYKRTENKLKTLFYYFISQIHLFVLCLSYAPKDTLFYINTYMPFAAAIAAKLTRKKVIYHIHEVSLSPPILKSFLRAITKLTANKVIYVSNFLQQSEKFQNKQQDVIHNALQPTDQAPQKANGKFTALMICSLKSYKGINEYLEIANKLASSKNITFQLVLNATRNEVADWKSKISPPENLSIFERQENTAPFYAEADILLNLSRPDECIETFGLTILEGMSYSLPVIVPPIGGPAEIVTDGQEGYLVSCYETTRIAEIIKGLSENQELYFKLAKNAKQRSTNFSIEEFEKKILNIIK